MRHIYIRKLVLGIGAALLVMALVFALVRTM